MKTIKQILAEKTKPLTTVAPEDTVQHALELMRDRDIGAVMVADRLGATRMAHYLSAFGLGRSVSTCSKSETARGASPCSASA